MGRVCRISSRGGEEGGAGALGGGRRGGPKARARGRLRREVVAIAGNGRLQGSSSRWVGPACHPRLASAARKPSHVPRQRTSSSPEARAGKLKMVPDGASYLAADGVKDHGCVVGAARHGAWLVLLVERAQTGPGGVCACLCVCARVCVWGGNVRVCVGGGAVITRLRFSAVLPASPPP